MAGKKKKGPNQSERLGLSILRGNQEDILKLMRKLGYNTERCRDVQAGLDWLVNVLLDGG